MDNISANKINKELSKPEHAGKSPKEKVTILNARELIENPEKSPKKVEINELKPTEILHRAGITPATIALISENLAAAIYLEKFMNEKTLTLEEVKGPFWQGALEFMVKNKLISKKQRQALSEVFFVDDPNWKQYILSDPMVSRITGGVVKAVRVKDIECLL